MAEISVIMPVYNAAETVGRMIDSILAQSFTDWELIAVDDGSTDGSAAILDDYAEKDCRIKVIHKHNGGVASARQAGIAAACGVFTIHADSDDWVEPDMLRDMRDKAMADDADMVIADFFTDCNDASTLSVQRPESTNPLQVLHGLYAKGLFGGLCHKLIRKSIYDKEGIRFVEGINYCEDLLILTKMLLYANPKTSYLPKAYYHYVTNDASLTRSVGHNGLESMKNFHREAAKALSGVEGFEGVTDSFAVNEFIVLFTNKLYGCNANLRKEYVKIKPLLSRAKYGLRWKVGFGCIRLGLTGLAHRLIHF